MMPHDRLEDAHTTCEHGAIKPGDLTLEDTSSEETDCECIPPSYTINSYPADFSLEELYEKWQQKELEIPEFPHQFTWQQVQASRLIESFLISFPVPPIFIYIENRSQNFFVLDGQQRLHSICCFFDGIFRDPTNGQKTEFRLKGLNPKSEYAESTFLNLSIPDKHRLKNRVLRCYFVKQIDLKDYTGIYHIFERLNTGGALLSDQQIRNCVYQGNFNALLHELNKFSDWRKIVGSDKADSRQQDIELILRCFAMLENQEYSKPMKNFLSKFMKIHQNCDINQLQYYRETFMKACINIVQSLGAKPFHMQNGINSAALDCIMANFCKNINATPPNIKEQYHNLIKNKNFLQNINSNSTDEEAVKNRFALAEQLFKK